MNLIETIEALEKGKRIRQSNYAKGVYLFMDEDGNVRFQNGEKYRCMGGVNLLDEWELYEDEKEDEIDNRKDVEDIIKTLFILLNDDSFIVHNAYQDFINKYSLIDYLELLRKQLIDMNKYYKLLDE